MLFVIHTSTLYLSTRKSESVWYLALLATFNQQGSDLAIFSEAMSANIGFSTEVNRNIKRNMDALKAAKKRQNLDQSRIFNVSYDPSSGPIPHPFNDLYESRAKGPAAHLSNDFDESLADGSGLWFG